MAHNADSRQSSELALNTLIDQLEDHDFPFETNSFYDFFAAMKRDAEIFEHARILGQPGVETYIDHLKNATSHLTDGAYAAGREHQKSLSDPEMKTLKERLQSERDRYMRPIDQYRVDVENFDWYYDFSDDITVYRRGKKREEELINMAKANGDDYKAIWMVHKAQYVSKILEENKPAFANMRTMMTDDLVKAYIAYCDNKGGSETFIVKAAAMFK